MAISFDDLPDDNQALQPAGSAGKKELSFDDLPDMLAPMTPAQKMQKSWENEPGYQYGSVLPYRKSPTGEHELAWPEVIRSPMRGVADIARASEAGVASKQIGDREPLSPDALGVIAGLSPRPPTGAMMGANEGIPPPDPPAKPPELPVPQQRAQDIVGRAIREEGIDPTVVARNLEEAKKTGLPVRALDVATRQDGDVVTQGRNLMGLADVAANQPGPGAALAGQVSARVLQQTKQLGELLDNAVSNKNIYSIKDDALRAIDENAGPAYERAFQSGDAKPIQQQLGQQLSEIQQQKKLLEPIASGLRGRYGSIQEQMAEAERMAKDPFTYGKRGQKMLDELHRQAVDHAGGHDEVANTIGRLSNQETQISDLMQKVDNGTVTFAPGAVWSPRVQEFLSDPDIQRGMKGELLNLQKEALGEGRPFNPKDYGIMGYDESGMPIVAQVPNMRMLDAGKKALDAMIEKEKNPMTGELNRTGRALTIQKRGYVNELDRLNPDYAEARQAYADQASRLRAMKSGRNYMNMDKEEIERFFNDPSTSNAEKAYFAAGARRNLQDSLDHVNDGSSSINKIWKENVRGRLEQIFPNKAAFDDFSKNMSLMQDMQRTNNVMARGAQSAPRQFYQDAIKQTPVGIPGRILAAGKMMLSPGTQIPKAALDMMSNQIAKQVKDLDRETAGEIMNILLTDDPKKWEQFAVASNATGMDQKSMMFAISRAVRRAPQTVQKSMISAMNNAPSALKKFLPYPMAIGAAEGNNKAKGGSVPLWQKAMADYPWMKESR